MMQRAFATVLLVLTVLAAWRMRRAFKWRLVSSFLQELCWLAAPVLVAVTFVGIEIQNREESRPRLERTTKIAPVNALSSTRISKTNQSVSNSSSKRPKWIDEPRTTNGLAELIVIDSGFYSTEAEAETDLMAKALTLVHQDLLSVNTMGSDGRNWIPTDQDVRRTAIKQQYVEKKEMDFGSITQSMYQIWWQIELSPGVRAAFLPSWRREVLGVRIQRVGIVAASVALAASLVRLYCRMVSLTNGHYHLVWKGLVTCIAAAWMLCVRFLTDGRIW